MLSFAPTPLPFIIDTGCATTRFGIGSSSPLDAACPSVVMPSVVGRPKEGPAGPRIPAFMAGADNNGCFYGDAALARRGLLTLNYPMECGLITNWERMTALWQHGLSMLEHGDGGPGSAGARSRTRAWASSDRPIFLTEAPLVCGATSREKAMSVLFEDLNAPSACVASTASLAVHGSGCTTGTVLDVGEGHMYASAVYEGHHLPQATARLFWGGRDLTLLLERTLQKLYPSLGLPTTAARVALEEAKVRLGRVGADVRCAELDVNKGGCDPREGVSDVGDDGDDASFTLPDGARVVMPHVLQCRCAEPLFTPRIACTEGIPDYSVQDMLCEAIGRGCGALGDDDAREVEGLARGFLGNIVVCGGSTRFVGFTERLSMEVQRTIATSTNRHVTRLRSAHNGTGGTTAPIAIGISEKGSQFRYASYSGASILASLSSFQQRLITRAEYEECGPSIVHGRCY